MPPSFHMVNMLSRIQTSRRRLFVGFLVSLAAVIALRLWTIASEVFSSDGAIYTTGITLLETESSGSLPCKWRRENGPVLYRLQHSTEHPQAHHWFHVAETFTGLRAQLEEGKNITASNGTVYMQVLDPNWMAELTPMARLLIIAGLTTVGSEVRFVDANRASFSFPEDGTESPSGQPPNGQVGLVRFASPGRGREFVLSPKQPLPGRLTVSGGALSARRSFVRGQQEPRPICVKYLSTVGYLPVARVDWFPRRETALSMRQVIDAYCPISWLRQEGTRGPGRSERGLSTRKLRYGWQRRRVGENGTSGAGQRLLIYQRDKNRVLVGADDVASKLRDRLGPQGWTVEIIVHDSTKHPCELIAELSGVDVLVTAHGFQSMLALFMRRGSLLFEIFPHKYFKQGYAPMAEGLEVRHAYSESRSRMWFLGYSHPTMETCMDWYLCRWYARQSNVELDDESFERVVALALETRPQDGNTTVGESLGKQGHLDGGW